MTRDLIEEFRGLPDPAKRRVHRLLCAAALQVWDDYAAATGRMTYYDSVVGLAHTVDVDLPGEAWRAAFDATGDASAIAQGCLEPIAALQDGDWELPDMAQFAYYAVYNAFLRYACGETRDDWVIVNQALAALPPDTDVRTVLQEALAQAAGSAGQDQTMPPLECPNQ